MGGGTRMYCSICIPARGLSPRGRGNRVDPQGRPTGGRSIPAWAGEPVPLPLSCHLSTVYPRVGGGTSYPQGLSATSPVHSTVYPRVGGGTLLNADYQAGDTGSIPAWAGEPVIHGSGTVTPTVYPRVGGGT